MKKQIPQKIVNIVYDKLLAGKRLERSRRRSWLTNWREEIFYKPNSNEVYNRFYKNKVSRFIFIDKDDWFHSNKQISTTRRTQNFLSKYNDYIQERPKHILNDGEILSQSRKL